MPRGPIESYEDLEVWQLAMDLAEMSYALTKDLPREEVFGLSAQMKRAAVSIPSNIAEGYGRDGTASFVYFLRVALGSARELETQLLLAARLGLVANEQIVRPRGTAIRVSKMLRALVRRLEDRQAVS
jgi:four helix bundle protein